MQWTKVLVAVALMPAACGSSKTATDGAVQREAAPPFADECTMAFGTPQQLAPGLSGQTVVLEGELDRFNNPIMPGDPTCKDGLGALVMWTKGVGDFSAFVRLTTDTGDHIFCGCDARQNSLCPRFPPGAHARVKGALRYTTTTEPVCAQPPCYLLKPQDRCFLQGCSDDRQCAGSTCDPKAHRCRALPAAPCHQQVGCESPVGKTYVCAKTGSQATCQLLGNGSQGSVCNTTADCKCSTCLCSEHVCGAVSGPP